MRFYNKENGTEAIPGIHFDPEKKPEYIVELDGDNPFFQDIPEGKELTFTDGVPSGITDSQPKPLTEADYTNAAQNHLDLKAKELGYDNIFTAVTYADEPAVAKFQQEGQALRAWRSQVWEKCYEILAEVEGEIRTAPTVQELILELPAFVAP